MFCKKRSFKELPKGSGIFEIDDNNNGDNPGMQVYLKKI